MRSYRRGVGGDAAKAHLGAGTFLVEHYWPGVTTGEFATALGRVRASADELAREGVDVRYLHSTLVLEDEAAFCVLAAASREFVERAYARAGVAFERLVEAVDVDQRVNADVVDKGVQG
jgi:hypothetical protein